MPYRTETGYGTLERLPVPTCNGVLRNMLKYHLDEKLRLIRFCFGIEANTLYQPVIALLQMPRFMTTTRLFTATLITLLTLDSSSFASTSLNGIWVLDLQASDSPEPIMKRMEISVLERKLAASTKLEATHSQAGDVLTIITRGPTFSRTEQLRLDGHPESKIEKSTGPYTIRSDWSRDGKELISTSTFRTKNGANAELAVARKLINNAKTSFSARR